MGFVVSVGVCVCVGCVGTVPDTILGVVGVEEVGCCFGVCVVCVWVCVCVYRVCGVGWLCSVV